MYNVMVGIHHGFFYNYEFSNRKHTPTTTTTKKQTKQTNKKKLFIIENCTALNGTLQNVHDFTEQYNDTSA